MAKPLIIAALAALLIPALCNAQTDMPKEADPYRDWSGPEYRWPQSSLSAPSLSGVWEKEEMQSIQRYVIAGSGMRIKLNALAPLRPVKADDMPAWAGSALVLEDSRYAGAYVFFTIFDRKAFIEAVDANSLKGYAKAILKDSDRSGAMAEIVDAPAQLAGRRILLLGCQPFGLTWKYRQSEGQITQRTDFFFDTEEKLMVVSVVGSEDIQNEVRKALEEILRRGTLEL